MMTNNNDTTTTIQQPTIASTHCQIKHSTNKSINHFWSAMSSKNGRTLTTTTRQPSFNEYMLCPSVYTTTSLAPPRLSHENFVSFSHKLVFWHRQRMTKFYIYRGNQRQFVSLYFFALRQRELLDKIRRHMPSSIASYESTSTLL